MTLYFEKAVSIAVNTWVVKEMQLPNKVAQYQTLFSNLQISLTDLEKFTLVEISYGSPNLGSG
jgi:hypothetical protein